MPVQHPVTPGVQIDRRKDTVTPETDLRVSDTSSIRYVTCEEWFDEFLTQISDDFGFGRVDVDVDGRALFINPRAQQLLGHTHFAGSTNVFLRQLVPQKYQEMHDTENESNVIHQWIGSREIVRALGKSTRIKLVDKRTGETRTVLISLVRPMDMRAMATAILMEQKQIQGIAQSHGLFGSKIESTAKAAGGFLEKVQNNLAAATLVGVIAFLCVAAVSVSIIAPFVGYYVMSNTETPIRESDSRYRYSMPEFPTGGQIQITPNESRNAIEARQRAKAEGTEGTE